MERARLEVFRQLIQDRLSKLDTNMGSRIGQLVDQRDSLPDQTDLATEESDRDMVLRLNEHERRTAAGLQMAIRRIDAGEYGECQACGEDIAEKRLMANPTATHCIDCMIELESRSGLRM